MSAPHVLYRFFDADGALLYVGITNAPFQRFRAHQIAKSWWGEVTNITVENHPSRAELIEAERAAIADENPRYNIYSHSREHIEERASVPFDGRSYSLAEAAKQICADTMKRPELWVRRKIADGTFRAMKVGRHIRMTDRQIEDAIASLEIGSQPEPSQQRRLGVTSASMRRRAG